MSDRSHTHRGEAGFTLVELLIVCIIILALTIAAVFALNSARASTRNEAMKAAAGTIDVAIGTLNRVSPPVPHPDTGQVIDPLSRIPTSAAGMSANPSDPNKGLADEAGEWLVQEWPQDPYSSGGVRLRRGGTSATCTVSNPQPGDIGVCRTSAARPGAYQVVAWGRSHEGKTTVVYRASH